MRTDKVMVWHFEPGGLLCWPGRWELPQTELAVARERFVM